MKNSILSYSEKGFPIDNDPLSIQSIHPSLLHRNKHIKPLNYFLLLFKKLRILPITDRIAGACGCSTPFSSLPNSSISFLCEGEIFLTINFSRQILLWDMHIKSYYLIASSQTAHWFYALISKTHSRVALSTRRNMHIDFATNRGNRDRASQNSRCYRYGNGTQDVASRSAEKRVWLDIHIDVQISIATSFYSLVSLPCQANRIAIVNSRWDLYCDGGHAAHLHVKHDVCNYCSTAMTFGARLRIYSSRTVTMRTGRHGHHDSTAVLNKRKRSILHK